MSTVLIVTDAWHPQLNGVVRCIENLARELRARGVTVEILAPDRFWTVPMPSYPEIRLSLASYGAVSAAIERIAPTSIHIATEGPLGLQAKRYCRDRKLDYTTSFHTRFPEYVAARLPIPMAWSYAYLRWFHAGAHHTLVPTRSIRSVLRRNGFRHLSNWTRGVDHVHFSPGPKTLFADLPGPHLLYVGRVAVEKNIEAFLKLACPGTKIIVGDGPQFAQMRVRYPEAVFLGSKTGADLVACYRSADVFVFPSRTDTFGNVMIEALACGVPVAAYPVHGPLDVLTDPRSGALDEDLAIAIGRALPLSRAAARQYALTFTWSRCADMFMRVLQPTRRISPVS